MSGLDKDVLHHAISTARAHGFRSIKLRLGEERFRAVLGDELHDTHFEPKLVADDPPVDKSIKPANLEITAPVVGYFREGKQPLETGRIIQTGEALCEIVALGIANDVVAKLSGEIVEVLIGPGDAVEYGQILAVVKAV